MSDNTNIEELREFYNKAVIVARTVSICYNQIAIALEVSNMTQNQKTQLLNLLTELFNDICDQRDAMRNDIRTYERNHNINRRNRNNH